MPHYVILGNWTEQGIRNVKDSPKRAAAAKQAVQKAGGKWIGLYYTFGQYDFVAIMETPSDEAAMSVLLNLGSQGNVHTTTLRAFPESEGFKIIKKV